MKLLEKILLATDFGSGAEDALQTAIYVAKHFQAKIILLHVVPGSSQRYSQAADVIRTSVEEELRDLADRIRAQGVPDVQTMVQFGIAFNRINQQAEQQDVNLIIMAARETAGRGPRGLGTTAAGVRRYASKPVWIVKPGTAPPINKILCPVDLSDVAGRSLRNAIHLSRTFQAELTVLKVAPGSPRPPKRAGQTVAEAEDTEVEQEQLRLDRFIRDFDFHNIRSRNLLRRRKPHEEIVSVVGELQSDLLVMGSVGRRGLGRMLMGGVGRKVAREMPCSIVTIRSEHAIRPQLDTKCADIGVHFKQGHELLALGFPEEAGREFRRCIAANEMHAPAWEGLAAVHERLGRYEEAKRFEEQAEHVAQTLYLKQVEAEIRREHPLFRPLFGIK
jgi:nucleotide-binding universal stress UspA family protein